MQSEFVDPGRHFLRTVTAWAREHSVPLVTGDGRERGSQ